MGADERQRSELWWHEPSCGCSNPRKLGSIHCQESSRIFSRQKLRFSLCRYSYQSKHSSLSKLLRIFAYVLRFIINILAKKVGLPRTGESPTVQGLHSSLTWLTKFAQRQVFPQDFQQLKSNQDLHAKIQLLSLNPFLDENDVIRVSGRLRRAAIPYGQKFSVILPSKHPFTKLLNRDYHYKHIHAGLSALLATIRQRYWIIASRRCTRSVL